MDDDYWEDYGEFNEEIDNLKASLKLTVKKEVSDELARLRKENKELQEKQSRLRELERETADAKRQAEHALANASKEAARMRYDDLLKTLATPRYFANSDTKVAEKCNKCDDKRQLIFKSADGQKIKGNCSCNHNITTYFVGVAYVFTVSTWNGKQSLIYDTSTRDDEMRRTSSKVYEGQDFEQLDTYYQTLFDSKEKCQEYVDYRNQREQARYAK